MPSVIIIDDAPAVASKVFLGHSPSEVSSVKTFSGLTLGNPSPSRIAVLLANGFSSSSSITLNGYPLSMQADYGGSASALWSGSVPTGNTGVDLIVTLPANALYVTLALYVLYRCRSLVPVSVKPTMWSTPNGTGTYTTLDNLTGIPRGSGLVSAAFPMQNNYTMALSSPNISSDGQVAHTILGGYMDSGHGVATASTEAVTYSVTKSINGFAYIVAAAFR